MSELRGDKEISEARPRSFKLKVQNTPVIRVCFPELTWKCQEQGYPDFARITIRYVPKIRFLELRSLKLWFNSFRDRYIGYEKLADEIFETLWQELDPQSLYVRIDINPRGNMKTDLILSKRQSS
ncbi:MAG: NADPH-dependent 7-cyano-7-deazaguanine reductase QueF [Candidatus Sungiibacteriota bacterium]|uniref:NADPH-dependent 7-cyano-7-deazaguanine reductase QueF n=1 Tax=Candidatus Sungiibacteriota bacterium TaxID=2750080 RepID=A0A7T5URJ6_9BACT|nr:MAG: NADPH-dependent 7-cyano-7-deazaguanine reductase QueF [Candidatus Sungbacteria bacterium]